MPKIRYACASLTANESAERKTINLDFAIGDSTKFNQIVFPLTQRGREYLPNIPLEEKMEWAPHSLIPQLWKEEKRTHRWIGKANSKKKWIPGKITKTHRIEKTGAFLVFREDTQDFLLKVWIEDWHFEIVLAATDNHLFPFKGEFRDEIEVTSVKGQWV